MLLFFKKKGFVCLFEKFLVLMSLSAACIFSACSGWNVSSLSGTEMCFLENGAEAGNLVVRFDEFALSELSFKIGVFGNRIFTADNAMHRMQVLDSEGKPRLVIGDLKNIDTGKTASAPFKFGTIGCFTSDREGRIYVQNCLSQSVSGTEDFSPSYVLVFDRNGKLQYTLGATGPAGSPFYYIDSLFVDDSGRLFVVSRSFDTWTVYRFTEKKRDFFADLKELKFQDQEGSDVYEGQIENIKLYRSGDMMLISVAFYHNKRLKFHRIYDYSVREKRIIRDIVTLPDPKNVLFSLVDEKNIYLWNMDRQDIRLMICNMEGHILNNIQLAFDGTRYLYSDLIYDEAGRLYTYHVNKKGALLYRWE